MNSALLECRLLHHRLRPREHRFANRIFLFALDLAEIERLANRLRLFSRNRRNLYAFWDRDFLPSRTEFAPGGEGPVTAPLLERVRGYLCSQGMKPGPDLRVTLLAIPRVAGYLFNPVVFYFCHEGDQPLCALAEVTNTFREVKLFFLGPETLSGDRFACRMPKEFYVSPFTDSGGEFAFSMRYANGDLSVRIDEYEGGELMLHSGVGGRRRDLSDAALAWFAIKYPLLGLQVMARIHTQALRLYLKRLPWWRKNDQLASQRNYHRPAGAAHESPIGEREA